MSVLSVVALLVLLAVPEGISQGIPLRCECITSKVRRPIGRFIGNVQVKPATSHCTDIEIIATLKRDGQRVCLDPDAPWVKKVIERLRKGQSDIRERRHIVSHSED